MIAAGYNEGVDKIIDLIAPGLHRPENAKKDEDFEDAPDEFIDPMMCELMEDPVINAAGQTYGVPRTPSHCMPSP